MITLDKNKKYLISGGSGYLGTTLIKRLIEDGFINLVVVARNEGNLIKLKEKYPSIEIITGDIANGFIAEKACKDVSGIFHLAAFKHIGLAEENVRECIGSNVMGTINLLYQTLNSKIEFILGISTDKAAQVNGVYGATKMLQEKLFHEYNKLNPNTKYLTVRYGNVIYSTGSVLCKWKDKLEKGEEITVTDLDSTRFYWTAEQAVDLIFNCLKMANDSTPYCPTMKSIILGDLLNVMMNKYSKNSFPVFSVIGLQPGENMHETIDGKIYSNQVEHYTQEEINNMV